MFKFNKNKSLYFVVSIIVICGLVSIVGLGKAQQQKSEVAELTDLANALGNNVDAFVAGLNYLGGSFGDMLGGASRFPNSHIYTGDGFYTDGGDGYNWGTYSASGGNPVLTDGLSERVAIITVTATSSGAIINPEDETIYVFDGWTRIQTATDTIQELRIGTSTIDYVTPETSCSADDTCSAADAKEVSILQTGDIAANTAVGATYFKDDYQGTDTTDGSGTRYVVPVEDDQYITCSASTTLDIAYGAASFQCGIKYYVVED